MPELPADFDLKLMPDWLKEPAGKNPYADYEGRDDDRRSRGRDDWGGGGGGRGRQDDRRGRPGGGQRPGGGPRRDDRQRKDAPGGQRKPDGKRPDSRPAGRQDDRRGKPGEQRRDDRRAPEAREQGTPVQPANVAIEFFPDEGCAVSIGRQVKSTHRAYSLFDLARMFLAKPERHRLKISTKSVAEPLFQVGEDGPVWTDRAAAERAAFPILRHKYYVEVTEQREAPKGNFSNVARCRANGMLLGPTNYHGYQPALRRLFEERFSRRMSFADFQREIEVLNDPALVEQWKQQASSVTVYRLKPEEKEPEPAAKQGVPEKSEERAVAADPAAEQAAEAVGETPAESTVAEAPVEAAVETHAPEAAEAAAEDAAPAEDANEPAGEAPAPVTYEGPVFNSLADVEAHFRQNYLPTIVRSASSFHLTGEASRSVTDRSIAAAVRQAWEQERGFPGQMMHQLRQQFSRVGLHIFKHRKRMQFVSLIRPSPMENGSLSTSVAEILQFVQGNQNCNRNSLATAILGADEAAVDPARKSTLATDLRWLIETGRVIEFSDGRLELPVSPAKAEPGKADAAGKGKTEGETAEGTAAMAENGMAAEAAPISEPTDAVTEPVAGQEVSQETQQPVETLAEAVEATSPAIESLANSVTGSSTEAIPQGGYEPDEPIARISPAAEQEPIVAPHLIHVPDHGSEEETSEPEPVAVAADSERD